MRSLAHAGNLDSSIGKLGSLLGLLKLLLGLAELGKVEGGDLLSLLDLLLVGLDLCLQLVGKLRHPVLVLLVFILGKLELLDLPVGSLVALDHLAGPALSASKLSLQLPHPLLQPGQRRLASFHGSRLSAGKL